MGSVAGDTPVPDDLIRDHLERVEALAEAGGYGVIKHLAAMALMELNERDRDLRKSFVPYGPPRTPIR